MRAHPSSSPTAGMTASHRRQVPGAPLDTTISWTPSSCRTSLRLRPPTAQTPAQPQKTPGPSPLLPQDVGFGCQCPPHHSTLLGRRQTEASPGTQVSMGHLRPISSSPVTISTGFHNCPPSHTPTFPASALLPPPGWGLNGSSSHWPSAAGLMLCPSSIQQPG